MRTTKPQVKRWKWGNGGWVIEGLRDDNGKRKRKFFPSRDAANEWLSQRRPELKNQGRAALGLTDAQRVDAVRAILILAPLGLSLTKAAEEFVERAQLFSRTVSFVQLRGEFEAAKKADRMSLSYLSDLSHRLERFGKDFDDRPVAAIESCEIDDWLRSLNQAPTSRVNFRKVLRTAFEYAVSRGYARDNPVVRTAEVKVVHAPPGILTPKEIDALLTAADAKVVSALALSAFAGIRDAEAGRMTWDRVDLIGGYVKVDAAIAKTSSRRLIPISDNLRTWLAPYAQKTGQVRPTPRVTYPLYLCARKAAAAALKQAGESASNLENWPHNALRHSFVSYRMALVANAAQVAEECGHSVQIMKTHYRALVTKSDAEAWFTVVPQARIKNVVYFSAQVSKCG